MLLTEITEKYNDLKLKTGCRTKVEVTAPYWH